MTRPKRFAWVFPLVVLLLIVGCRDKSDKGRASRTESASKSRPAQGGAERPLIGLTSTFRSQSGRGGDNVRVQTTYIDCIVEAGGVPIIIPVNQGRDVLGKYVQELDGLVLIGGADIPPNAYGEEPAPQTKTMPAERYEFESRLISLWLDSDKPLLGVCLGAQFVNVVAGGTLIQDIPTQVGREVIHRGKGAGHDIIIDPESRLRKILAAERVRVNSSHHQAVRDVGKGLKVVARSEDGVIEAMESTSQRFCLLVQWHPERMSDAKHRKAIFGALINACKKK